eukprot:scaffold107094_cov60-Phaeocystis_antarctica.AAC.1
METAGAPRHAADDECGLQTYHTYCGLRVTGELARWRLVGKADDLNSLDFALTGPITRPARVIRQLVTHPTDTDGRARRFCADGGALCAHMVKLAPLDDNLKVLGEPHHIVRGSAAAGALPAPPPALAPAASALRCSLSCSWALSASATA